MWNDIVVWTLLLRPRPRAHAWLPAPLPTPMKSLRLCRRRGRDLSSLFCCLLAVMPHIIVDMPFT